VWLNSIWYLHWVLNLNLKAKIWVISSTGGSKPKILGASKQAVLLANRVINEKNLPSLIFNLKPCLADRNNGRAYATVLCPSVRLSVSWLSGASYWKTVCLKKQIGNGLWGIEWSRNWSRHVTLKRQHHFLRRMPSAVKQNAVLYIIEVQNSITLSEFQGQLLTHRKLYHSCATETMTTANSDICYYCIHWLHDFSNDIDRHDSLTLWRRLLSYEHSYRASCARRSDRVVIICNFLTSGHSDAQGWAPECPDVKNYKWRLNRLLCSCTHFGKWALKG